MAEAKVKKDKIDKVLGANNEMNGNETELTGSIPMPPYRILCNSEHFIVLNPTQKKPRKNVDNGHKERGPVILKGK